jgi:DNA-directed RNA polymerase subunit omega
MARITIEDGLNRGYNKFLLVHLAAKRVVQLRKGKDPLVACDNREIVTSLREIEQGKVRLKPEADLSESYLQMEPELPAPQDDQIEPGTVVKTDEETDLEIPLGVDGQEKQEAIEVSGAEVDSEVKKAESDAPGSEEGEADKRENR